MNYTEKLDLPVVTDTDDGLNFVTQGNEISNKIEEKLGTYDDTVSALTTLTGTVTDLNSDYNEFKVHTDKWQQLATATINNLSKTVDVISFKDTDGTVKKGRVKTVIINNINYSASQTTGFLPKYDGTAYPLEILPDKRIMFGSAYISASINLTTELNLENPENIRIIAFNAYDDNAGIINRGNLPKLEVKQIGLDGANLYLRCGGGSTSMVEQYRNNDYWIGGNMPPLDTTVNLDVAITYLEIITD